MYMEARGLFVKTLTYRSVQNSAESFLLASHTSGSCDVCPHVAAARAYLRYIAKVAAVIQLLQ